MEVTTASIPTFDNASDLEAQLQAAFGTTFCVLGDSNRYHGACANAQATPIYTLELADDSALISQSCPFEFSATIRFTKGHSSSGVATTYPGTVEGRVSTFNGATYYKPKVSGDVAVSQTALTNVGDTPANGCAGDNGDAADAGDTPPTDTGASTLTAVGAALVFAAIF